MLRSARQLLLPACLIGAIALLAFRQASPDVLRAQRFEVVNADGKVVMLLNGGDAGGEISVWNAAHGRVCAIYPGPEGATLMLFDAAGHPSITIDAATEPSASISTKDGAGVDLQTTPAGASLRVNGANLRHYITLSTEALEPMLLLKGDHSRHAIYQDRNSFIDNARAVEMYLRQMEAEKKSDP